MRGSKLGVLASGFAASCWLACAPVSGVFVCSDDAECTGAGVGSCQANGYCAFPDAQCDSGLRYGEYAGGGFAELCVPVDEGSTGGAAMGASTVDASETSDDEPLATGVSPATSTDGSTGSVEHASSSGTAETGGTAACAVVFDDDFEDTDLPGHWMVLGPASVTATNGAARFQLRTEAGTTMLRHVDAVPLEGVWLEAQLEDVSDLEVVHAFITLATDDELQRLTLAIATGGKDVAGYRVGAAGEEMLFSMPYDETMRWLALREVDGHVSFELGSLDGEWETIYEADIDLRGSSGWMEFGASNSAETPDEEVVSFADAIGCAQNR